MAVSHSCLLCSRGYNHNSRKTKIYSPYAFKSHLLSEEHLAAEAALLELKKQKKQKEIKDYSRNNECTSYAPIIIGEIKDNGKVRILGHSRLI